MTDVEIAVDTPITEDLMRKIGININGLIAREGITYDEFTSNGTWNSPSNVTHAWVYGCGGGGGGAGGYLTYGCQGGSGAVSTLHHVLVTPSTAYSVTIGAGGAGGAGSANGSSGGDTTLGSLINFKGAIGGYRSGTVVLAAGGGHYSVGGSGTVSGTTGAGANSFYASGGAAGTYGGGGGAGIGAGGAGTSSPGGTGSSAAANSGGGGGGGMGAGSGGSGGSGYLRIIYASS